MNGLILPSFSSGIVKTIDLKNSIIYLSWTLRIILLTGKRLHSGLTDPMFVAILLVSLNDSLSWTALLKLSPLSDCDTHRLQ